MRILIATGIYPPKTSGPAQYAQNMHDFWSKMGHKVWVETYGIENHLPTGVRHLWYFFKIIPKVLKTDMVFGLDTFSVGFPATLACKIFNKKIVIRTGGDFLWEGYVERTGDLVLLRDFYNTRMHNLSFKEKMILFLTKWTLNNVDLLVFSTRWQKDIFKKPYELDERKISIIENHYERSHMNTLPTSLESGTKYFIAGTRPLKWKNITFLKKVFENEEIKSKEVVLDPSNAPYKKFMEKMSRSYAVILVSLGDISPHMILDAISLNKPFIVTEECGLLDRIGSVAITVNPKNEKDIKEKVSWLLDESNYVGQTKKIKNFSFTHTWKDIAQEYENLFKKII